MCSVCSILSGFLTLPAGEYGRFGIQEAVLIRVAIVVLLVASIDAVTEWWVRWRQPPVPPADPAGRPGG